VKHNDLVVDVITKLEYLTCSFGYV
jgi:hypothetical protein